MVEKKVIVIGLDGATWDLIEPWAKEGKLTTIKKLMDDGIYSTLWSTVPSYTLPAWTSLISGVNPGKHKIYDLIVEHKGNTRLVTSKDRETKTIFEILSAYDKASVAVNIPGTFPPDKIKGAMVSGTLTTPKITDKFVYPEDLHQEISSFFIRSFELDYKLLKYLAATNKDEFIKILDEAAEQEVKATILLSRKFKPYLLWHVFRTTDIAQHYLYDSKDLEGENCRYLLQHYQKVDSLIKKIIESFPRNSSVLTVSDHGFAPLKKYFYVNTWLENNGLLVRKRKKYNIFVFESIMRFGNEIIKLLTGKMALFDKIMLKIFKTIFVNDTLEKKLSNISIDFSRSKAYSPTYTSQAIKIMEHKVAEKNKISDEIISKLYKLEDPESGKKIIEKVYKREDIYSGDYLSEAPEILITTKEGYILTSIFSPNNFPLSYPSKLLGAKTGDHRPNGVFIVKDEILHNFGRIDATSIYDIAPTILYLMGIPIPKHMDGKPLRGLFSKEIVTRKSVISQDEKKRVRNKIKELRCKGKI